MKMMRKLSVLFMAFILTVSAIAPAAVFADETDGSEYVYGTVNMDYADFYYGELLGIEPSDDTAIPADAEDPVTKAGYREEGYYDAATLATPRGFIYEKKWQDGYPGSYNEPIFDEYGNIVGGKILGVKAVNVAVKKDLYEKAMVDKDSVVGQKAALITLNQDQSQIPLSYKVLNADGVYSKYVNLTDPVETDLDGYLTTEFMGDDIWWEGKSMKHTNDQTILGGVIEYKKDPLDPDEKPVVLGLKHDENMYSDTWIGWGMGPGNVGIYGGNETGWQRFSGIAGNYLTKMSYILMEEDGSVHYYNASYNPEKDTEGKQMKNLLHPFVPSAVVEDGKHPYSAGITNYEFTKDRIKIDFEISVPLRADGTREVDYYLRSLNVPGGSISPSSAETNPEILPVYEESEWESGKKTIHLEINRKYMSGGVEKSIGTGRYKYWIYVNNNYEKQEGDRYFTGVAAWKMLYTDETPEDIYLENNKLVVNSDIFTVEDYINNPYQQVEVYAVTDEGVEEEDVFATGDANTNTTLFLGTTKQDGTPVKGLFDKDGNINFDAAKYSYNRRSGVETLDPIFPDDAEQTYEIILYSGGFPIVKGRVRNNAQAAMNKISELGDITLDSEEAVNAAKEEYDKLSDEEKAKVTNYEELLQAEVTLTGLKLDASEASQKELQKELDEVKGELEEAKTAGTADKKAIEEQTSRIAELEVKVLQVKKVKAKAAKKKAAVSWKALGSGYKYQVYVSTKAEKGFKKKATSAKTKAVVKKLKSKKTYYFKVRGYKTVNGKTVYTSFSDLAKAKVK